MQKETTLENTEQTVDSDDSMQEFIDAINESLKIWQDELDKIPDPKDVEFILNNATTPDDVAKINLETHTIDDDGHENDGNRN